MVHIVVNNLKELITDIVEDDFEIIKQKNEMLTPPGEHYGSIMLALDVLIKRKSQKEEVLKLVAKILPAHEMLRTAFDTSITFKKEVHAYLQAIPALVKFQTDYSVPSDKILDIFPKCYGARISLDKTKDEVDDDAVIILENLKVEGYVMVDRLIGFDFDHTTLIVKNLARFHAVTIALRILEPKLFEDKIGPCLVKNCGLEVLPDDVARAFHDGVFDNAKQIDQLKPFLKRVEVMVNQAAQGVTKQPQEPTTPYATLLHSDFWVNNTLMLYDENKKPINNKMVDFQVTAYGSALRDLIFFLFTSVIGSVLDEHYDDFILTYYNKFTENLKDFNIDSKLYPWEDYLKEIEELGPTEAYHICIMHKPIFSERGLINSLDKFETSDWSRTDVLGGTYRKKLQETIIRLAKKNWI